MPKIDKSAIPKAPKPCSKTGISGRCTARISTGLAALVQADKKAGAKAVKNFSHKNKLSMKPADILKQLKKTFKIAA